MLALLILFGTLLVCIYWSLYEKTKYWEKRGVPSSKPSILFGNVGPSLTLSKSIGEIVNEIYDNFPDFQYVGFYRMRTPSILVRDPLLIKDVLTKEFNSFHDNDIIIDETVDPIGGKNTFALKGHKWKVVKSQISPCFTSKKLKSMYPLINDAALRMIKYMTTELNADELCGIDAKELLAKYATDVVASCAFGLEGKSFDEPDPEFRRMGKKIFQPSIPTIIKQLLILVIPSLAQVLKVKKENNIVRNDFLDFIKDMKNKPGEYGFDDDDIVAHAMGFFTDGFETSSFVMCFVLYELAMNPDIQEKLLEEIKLTQMKTDEKLDYDTINEMKYLEAVVNEVLRMHPPGMTLLRVCTKPFTLSHPRGADSGPNVNIEVGTPVLIPVNGLHHNPKYFPNPHKFDPERFSEENKDHLTKFSYLPFGEGPRACHGQRFGTLQVKMAIARIVYNFEVQVNEKTNLPLKIDPGYLLPFPKGGIWLNFYKRNI